MKTVLFVYRILLPRLLLLRLCLARPSLTESRAGIQRSVETSEGSFRTQNTLLELFFGMNTSLTNEHPLLVQRLGRPTSERMLKDNRILRLNPGSPNLTRMYASRLNTSYSESMKLTILSPYDSRIFSNRFSQGRLEQEIRQLKLKDIVYYLPFPKQESKLTNWVKRSHDELPDGPFQPSLASRIGSLDQPGAGHTVRTRTRRSLKETLPLHGAKHSSSRQIPPEYMILLFRVLSGTHYNMMKNVVVTGFVNINNDEDYTEGSGSSIQQAKELIFDVAIRQETETIQYSELRLHVALKNRETGTDYSQETMTDSMSQSHDFSIFEIDPNFGPRLIAFKNIQYTHITWVSFNVTSAVKQWEKSGLKVLEVRISMPGSKTGTSEDFNVDKVSDFVLDIDVAEGKQPLLVVFSKKSESDDQPLHQIHKRDTPTEKTSDIEINKEFGYSHDNLLTIRPSQTFESLVTFLSTADLNSINQLPNKSVNNSSTLSKDYTRKAKYNAGNTVNKKVEKNAFLNILNGSTKKIKNSKRNQFSQASTTSRHKIKNFHIRDNKNSNFPPRFSNTSLESTSSVKGKHKLSKNSTLLGIKRETKSRYKRHLDSLFNDQLNRVSRGRFKRSKKKRNSCQRGELYVDFETIKWDKVIIFPRGYQAFECTGKCYTPMSEYLTPTKHAIIQTLVHTSYPDKASRACCVPTRLEPISLLYWDEVGNIKYDYTHEGMVAAECGCR